MHFAGRTAEIMRVFLIVSGFQESTLFFDPGLQTNSDIGCANRLKNQEDLNIINESLGSSPKGSVVFWWRRGRVGLSMKHD